MNVLVNAISIHGGGAFVVLKKLLEGLSTLDPSTKWYICADPKILISLPKSQNIINIPYHWPNRSGFHLIFWYEVVLPNLVSRIKPDLVFSQTNYLPRRKLKCPTLLLVQHAGHFSNCYNKLFKKWCKNKIKQFLWKQKTNWVKSSVKHATMVTVQTRDLASQIIKQTNIQHSKVKIINHGSGLFEHDIENVKINKLNNIIRIGYITKFGIQKDFETIIKALYFLKENSHSLRLILTLDPHDQNYNSILQLINKYQVHDVIENYGEVIDPDHLKKIYQSLDLFVFSSLCESFGFTLVEAMTCGVPVIVADTASNCEIVDDAGIIFKKGDAIDLSEKIQLLINDKNAFNNLSEKALNRSKHFNWQITSKNILNVMNQTLSIGTQ